MKVILLAFTFITSALLADSSLWMSDFSAAQTKAAGTKKPLLLFFTGSDWCTECKEFQSNILENDAFIKATQNRFICAIIDFPLSRPLPATTNKVNKELKERYKIGGLPTLVVILPSQNAISLAAPSSTPPERLAAVLLAETDAALTLDAIMPTFNPSMYSSEQLISLYQAAKLVSRTDWQEQILNAGLKKTSTNSFFLRERYRVLIQKGEKNSPEALSLRQRLLESDPDNELGHQLYVAVSDFEESLHSSASGKNVTEPLVAFLKRFHQKENSWKVNAMLASYFFSVESVTEAKYYLEEALKEAPLPQKESLTELLAKLQ